MPPSELYFENAALVDEEPLENTKRNHTQIPIATSAVSPFTNDGYRADPPLVSPRVITAFTADGLNPTAIPINASPGDFHINTHHVFAAGQSKPPPKRKK